MTVKWKIWYGDGSSWSDEDGPPEMAPSENVQIVRFRDDLTGVADTVYKCDWYYWVDNYPMGGDIHGLVGQLKRDKERKLHGVKEGRQLKRIEFEWLIVRAVNDPYIA